MVYIFDIETDGLCPTKIHCLSYCEFGKEKLVKTITDYDEIKRFFKGDNYYVGHDIIRFDIVQVERLLNIKIDKLLIDTLPLSWYLYPDRARHGLEWWGEEFGVKKPKVEDWHNLPLHEYKYRCQEDVKINAKLWNRIYDDLTTLYGSPQDAGEFIKYICRKMQCASEQQVVRWKLDVDRTKKVFNELTEKKNEKVIELSSVMPPNEILKTKDMPKVMKKKNGEATKMAEAWYVFLKNQNLPWDHTDPVEYIAKHETPNPNSVIQLKKWLTSLGWKPITFKNAIPQVRDGDKLCESVLTLLGKEPKLELLEGLTILTHRIGIVKGFLRAVSEDGYVKAEIAGLTNTLRFKHKVIVNLPKPSKPYGEDMRGCLIAPDGEILCGSDMSSLEDRTKQHYMYDFDPDYVNLMNVDGFDPHLDLAVFSGALTEEQAQAHKDGLEDHSEVRTLYKMINYASIYGAGASTIAKGAGISVQKSKELLQAYWERNKSVMEVVSKVRVKKCVGRLWLYNTVSKFWYDLRNNKDRFSTLNQSTGVFCFDTWVDFVRQEGLKITGQFHDEIILSLKLSNKNNIKKKLFRSIEDTNKLLKLNRPLGIDVQFGKNYAKVH